MTDFDKAVMNIARRRAVQFFAPRLIGIAAVVALSAFALTGCGKQTSCRDGKLYYRDGSGTLILDEWGRRCIGEKAGD